MFTVCPKCALTLVVTAADLRVAQGYVRCGRCSNVFNALARLSEDRQNAAAAAQAPPASRETSPSSAASAASLKPPSPKPPSAATTTAPTTAPITTTTPNKAPPSTIPGSAKVSPAPVPTPFVSKARGNEPLSSDDEQFPDDALEFNPNDTDVSKVFVEQAPSPQFTAATGTFKAIRLEAEDSARALEPRAQPTGHESAPSQPFDPTDTQVDVEIDPELLSAMALLGANRATSPPPMPVPAPVPSPPAPLRASSAIARKENTPSARLSLPARQSPGTAPTTESDARSAQPLPLAARAQARAIAARPAPVPVATGRSSLAALARAASAGTQQQTAEIPNTARPERLWIGGSILMVLMLLVQVVHHYRHDLAANPQLNGPLTSLYAALGIPLVPHWSPNSYEVRQLGASTAADAPGQITVRASVKNGAHQSLPLPLLRVTLQDRFGNRIAARDVPPQSYLPRAIPSTSLLSSGQRIDAEMAFVDPGSNAVGFEIDACLPAPGGGVACANDSTR